MTERFLKAMPEVFLHEGGFNNIKGDNGGATNWGISLALLKSLNIDINEDHKVDWLDIKVLSKEEAQEIYFNNFWKPFYDTIKYEKVAIKIFDIGVNAGSKKSHILLQRALVKLGSTIVIDGMIGKNTLNEITKYTEDQLLKSIVQVQSTFYNDIVKANPTQSKFLKGWLNRANWIPTLN